MTSTVKIGELSESLLAHLRCASEQEQKISGLADELDALNVTDEQDPRACGKKQILEEEIETARALTTLHRHAAELTGECIRVSLRFNEVDTALRTSLKMLELKLPPLVAASTDEIQQRYKSFFIEGVLSPNTAHSYAKAVAYFLDWCERRGVASIADVGREHVSEFIAEFSQRRAASTARHKIFAVRRVFAWLKDGGLVETNPAT